MALSDEDRAAARALGESLTLTPEHLDLLEEVAVSAPRQRRSEPADDGRDTIRRAS